MITKMYCVFDKKAKIYNPPVFLHNTAVACRAFGELANNPDHQYGKHPGDYELWEVGTYDDGCGLTCPLEDKTHVIDFADLVGVPA